MTAKRKLPDWISGFQEYMKHSESPVSFHWWGGVAAIAAAMQRKCYMKWGYNTIYPNQYIVLVGPSGQSRKGDAINQSRWFVERLEIPMLGEDNSQEAIIREMKTSTTTFKDQSSGRIMFQCAVSVFLEELSVFTGQQNTQFLAYLTNWYDSRDKWKRTTKHQGTDEIMGMCFNMFAATAPDWLPYILPREAIGGGFTSRCIFVVESGKSKIVSNPNDVQVNTQLKADLIHDLRLIHSMSGEYKFSPKALEFYCEWYEREEKKMADGRATVSDPLLAGYNARRAMHLIKLSTIMAASVSSERIVGEKDIKRARTLLEVTEKNMPRAFAGIGRSRYSEETQSILAYIAQRRSCTKSEIFRALGRNIDAMSFDAAIKVLDYMKVIKTEIGRSDVTYVYTGESPDGVIDTPSGKLN